VLRRFLLLVLLAAALVGCPEDRCRRSVPGGVADLPDVPTKLLIDLQPRSAGLPGPVRLLVLAWDPEELYAGRPRPGSRPVLAWRSEGLAPKWPIKLALPLPPGSSVMVVRDANANGQMDDDERVGGPLTAPEHPDEVIDVVLDRYFAVDPKVALLIDLDPSGASIPGPIWLLVLAWDAEDLIAGNPRPGSPPVFAWRSEDLPAIWPIRIEVPLPAGSHLMVLHDANRNGRLDEGERVGGPLRAPDAAGQLIQLSLDRDFSVDPAAMLGDPGESPAPVEPSSAPP
jgi:hypothetical protein